MKARTAALIPLCCLMLGCTSMEGTYLPDCIAFSGHKITLEGGRFVWDRFTDQVVVGDDGEVVDQFPDYPASGNYRLDGDTLRFEPAGDVELPDMHLHRQDGKTFLLTPRQLEQWRESGNFPRCPLVQNDTD